VPLRRLTLLALALAAIAAPSASAVTAAHGRPGPCRPDDPSGPTCQVWMGTVKSINDGDTIGVDIAGDRSHREYQIRFTGIQAMEETRYSQDVRELRGQCHAVAAAIFVHRLVRLGHHRVRLTSQHPRTDRIGRPFRYLAFRIGGQWQDVGAAEMARGLTLWMNDPSDPLWNSTYNRLGQEAAQRHIGMFNTTTCGAGPAQSIPLKTWVMSNPMGSDTPAGEWVKLRNLDATRTIDLSHWWIRDSGLRRFTLPAGTHLGPGQTLTLHVGAGTSSGEDFYWGLGNTIFEDSSTGSGDGDGAYVFDPQGDLRTWSIYPCLVACTDPNAGALTVTAHARGVEYVTVTNTSSQPIDLSTYELGLGGGNYAFPDGSVVQPGQALTVYLDGSPASDSNRAQYAGMSGPSLRDSGGAIVLRNFEETVVSCSAWGSGSC
jgi:endonuclease YncB( thermonuclease family)